MGKKKIDFEERLYDIVWRVISYYDFLEIFGCGCPYDEYSGEIGQIYDAIKHNYEIDNIMKAIRKAFAFDLKEMKDVKNKIMIAACDIYKRIKCEDRTHKKLDGILMSDDIETDLYYGFDLDDLKEGDICSVSDLARHIDSHEVGSNYMDTLTDKVYKIDDDGIIFIKTEDQYSEQTSIHYYKKGASLFYLLERCQANLDRWVVFVWDIDSYGNLCETAIDWFNVCGTKTPEHIIKLANDNGVFNNMRNA